MLIPQKVEFLQLSCRLPHASNPESPQISTPAIHPLVTKYLSTGTQCLIAHITPLPVRSSVMLYKYPLTDFVSMPWLPGKAATPPLGVPAEMPHWLRTLV